jgi:hypothetical protein
VDERARRVAENEAVFREVNERIDDLAERLDVETEIVCECSRLDCAERLTVPADEYERVRAHGRRFLLAEGHEQPAVERVIDARGGWIVVEKVGEAGDVAEAEDPRA